MDDITIRFAKMNTPSSNPQGPKPVPPKTNLKSRPSLKASDPAKIEPFSLPPLEETRPLNIHRNGPGGSLRIVPDNGTTHNPRRALSQRSPSSPTKPMTLPPIYDMEGRVVVPSSEPPKQPAPTPQAVAAEQAPPPLPPKPELEPSGPPVASPPAPPYMPSMQLSSSPTSLPPNLHPPSYPPGASQPPYLDAGRAYSRTPTPPQPSESQPPYLSNFQPPEQSGYGLTEGRGSRSPSPSRRPPLPAAPQQSSYPGGPVTAQPPPQAPFPYDNTPSPPIPTSYGGGLSPYSPEDTYSPGGFRMPAPTFNAYSHPMMNGYYGSPQGPASNIPMPSFPNAWGPPPPPQNGYPPPGGYR